MQMIESAAGIANRTVRVTHSHHQEVHTLLLISKCRLPAGELLELS